MAMMKYGSAAVVESTINQDQWQKSKNAWKVECDEKGCQIKTAKTIIAKYSPDKYMLSHCTIIAAVDTELANPDDPKSDYFIHPVYSKFINNNGDSWSKKTLKLCYKSFIGADNFCEHIQIPELSKGKVVDAVLREIPIGKDKKGNDLTTYYVDILVATEKKHKKLVADIKSGKLNTLSMGCKIKFSICSKCGNRAIDDTEACQHVKYEKNNFFYDNYGTQRKVAELCGYHDDPESVVFIDASWVANPAFTGAVMRNVVDPPSDILAKIEKANKKGNYSIDETDFLKAAFKMAQEPEEKSEPEDTKEEEPAPDEPTPDEPAPDEPAPDEPAPDEPAPDEPVEDQNSVMTWKKRIKERLLRELGDELVRELEEDEPVIDPDLESLDDTLIQPTASAALKQMHKMKKSWDIYLKKYSSNMDKKTFEKLKFGTYMLLTSNDLTALSDYGYNKRDFLAVMSFLDNCFKKPLSLKLKKAIAEIGGLKGLNPSEVTFTLQKLAGKKLNSNELERSIVWLKLMDSYSS